MISVVIIGYGNVAHHLTSAFLKAKNIVVKQVYNRSLNKLNNLKIKILKTNKLSELVDADVYIIAISDDVISDISTKLVAKKALIVHTSGSVDIKSLHNKQRGVFYPLQSFSKEKEVDFNEIPFCLEAENENNYLLLQQLATSIGKKTYRINSEQRKYLHVAAVFVNNFTNHLYTIGNDICSTNNIPFEILHPLIKETSAKINYLLPKDAQTGPAKRSDQKTIENHLQLLNKQQKEIYSLLTKSIKKTYE